MRSGVSGCNVDDVFPVNPYLPRKWNGRHEGGRARGAGLADARRPARARRPRARRLRPYDAHDKSKHVPYGRHTTMHNTLRLGGSGLMGPHRARVPSAVVIVLRAVYDILPVTARRSAFHGPDVLHSTLTAGVPARLLLSSAYAQKSALILSR